MSVRTPDKKAPKSAKAVPKRPVGRPSSYSKNKLLRQPVDIPQSVCDTEAICAEIAEGRSLRSICQSAEMPDQSTVYRWLEKDGEFREQYARAREAQVEYWADQILDIADEATAEGVNHARLRIDARKWLMSKLAPKKYGEKLNHQVAGVNGGPIVVRWKEPGESVGDCSPSDQS